ncbi:hypothetical protein HK099_002850, partial [Clydaea vesicula]
KPLTYIGETLQDAKKNSPLQVIGNPITASEKDPFKINFYLNTKVTLYSPNYVTWGISDVNYTGVLSYLNNTDIYSPNSKIQGTGDIHDIQLKAMQNNTYLLPIMVSFSLNKATLNLLKDPGLLAAVGNCDFVTNIEKIPSKIHYLVNVHIQSGIKFQVEGYSDLDCPVKPEDWEKYVVSAFKIVEDVTDTIENIGDTIKNFRNISNTINNINDTINNIADIGGNINRMGDVGSIINNFNPFPPPPPGP